MSNITKLHADHEEGPWTQADLDRLRAERRLDTLREAIEQLPYRGTTMVAFEDACRAAVPDVTSDEIATALRQLGEDYIGMAMAVAAFAPAYEIEKE
ncbi:hypothetical protein [Fodinicurvata fenggangensis]|uniref:hypothetical protein n=1 Tax=Fodinicurvata fenggangensis TaxID=1121830 RepID=UPI00047BBECE|nr:hypothetical protein [Fodinicurvata fenggangensis]